MRFGGNAMQEKEYILNIDPRILELLGPSLYTNIYYIIAELVANAYDADAKDVYIIDNGTNITVEDDGKGMSYLNGDINKYLNVASISRQNEDEAITTLGRRKMGRKGVGKLAALSVSENVQVKTIHDNEKSGFVLSRFINDDKKLVPIADNDIFFQKITANGTSIVMNDPQYQLHSTLSAIKRNLLKIFPLVNKDFQIHIIRGEDEEIISDFDKEMVRELASIITLGNDFEYLKDFFSTEYTNNIHELMDVRDCYKEQFVMKSKNGVEKTYDLEIHGWIGAYQSTRGRKNEITDFPDNFISLYANGKLGEFNILPSIGQNKLNEVYVVGQLYVDIFELTELPDMALSNRQGYKTDDYRYQMVLKYVKNVLLADILKMRSRYTDISRTKKDEKKLEDQKRKEQQFSDSVRNFRVKSSENAANKIVNEIGNVTPQQEEKIKNIVSNEINDNAPDMGIKREIDDSKRKILLSQTYPDKDLADIIYAMLLFNNVPAEEIIYTNCDDEVSRIPEGQTGKSGIYNYLRDFFVNSSSTQKIYVIFVTSDNTKKSWGALTEVGASWITQVEHKIFNIKDFRPEHPLDDESQWHTSERTDGKVTMSMLSCDIFAQKIEYICDFLGYQKRDRVENKDYLKTLAVITNK